MIFFNVQFTNLIFISKRKQIYYHSPFLRNFQPLIQPSVWFHKAINLVVPQSESGNPSVWGRGGTTRWLYSQQKNIIFANFRAFILRDPPEFCTSNHGNKWWKINLFGDPTPIIGSERSGKEEIACFCQVELDKTIIIRIPSVVSNLAERKLAAGRREDRTRFFFTDNDLLTCDRDVWKRVCGTHEGNTQSNWALPDVRYGGWDGGDQSA